MKTAMALLVAIFISGCSSAEKTSETGVINLHFISTSGTNLDTHGQAAPLSINIYQLNAVDNFQNSDYFTLTEGEDAVLKNDIATVRGFMLKPGETRTLVLKPTPGVIALGVVAAYRDINHANWQKVFAIKNEDTRPWYKKMLTSEKATGLSVRFEPLAVSIKEMN
ncbi:type VI secretion system lipoprotein TssJ [Buttiauxella agrestis]|uniref:type VI secretion system lipoprotein TssJ n=1 Tax=Buttiauxella agrestis TaxID=82977 RepID=UPI003975DD2C